MTKAEVKKALRAMGYRFAYDDAYALLEPEDIYGLWPPLNWWRHPPAKLYRMDTLAERHPTLWLADNDLTGDELRAGKGMYFEDPIVAAVWLKTEASVKV